MPGAVLVALHVHRVLDRRAVGGPLLVRRQRGEADDLVRPVDGHDAAKRRPTRWPATPACSLERAGHQVERGRRRRAPRGCRSAGSPRRRPPRPVGCDRRAAGIRRGRARPGALRHGGAVRPRRERARPWSAGSRRAAMLARRSAALPRTALLAQSAEHSHGKEGVVGSIPTEGSPTGRGTCRRGQPRRRSSVGQSTRLIIGRSSVRARPPLPSSTISSSRQPPTGDRSP